MDEIVKDFLIESNENLDRLDQELVKLESDPTSKDLLAGIFRTIHTIKGSCGFLGFARLEKVAHAGENLLSRLRDGALSLNAEITSGLLAMVDAVRKMLAEIQATEHDGDNDYPELLSKMKDLQGNVKSSDPKPLMQATPKAANPAEGANSTGEVRILEIEKPEARRLAGKDPSGRLTLRAFHEGGRVNIEIEDDGAGLNKERLLKKALEKELVTSQQAQLMSERDVFNLIFLPGFSTAEKVTNVSGRGVGMDVVKTKVEKISGVIDIQSAAGKGTTVRVSIPLTFAIVPALVVSCCEERFAIPQVSVLELVGIDSANNQQVECVQGAPVYRLRENLLPLVYLNRQLRLRPVTAQDAPVSGSIVVLQAVGRQFGLVVDDILDTEEIVVKPLSEQFKGISEYSGATIMGDGRVALILDVLGLAQSARVLTETRAMAREACQTEARAAHSDTQQTLLLARNGAEGQVAIPLSNVTRLEGFPANLVKRVGDREFMEYRGQVIPVVRLSQVVPPAGIASHEALSGGSVEVVIYSAHGHTVAVIVDCIVDIVAQVPAADQLSSRHGVAGSFMSGENITELLDLPAIVSAAVPGIAELP